MNKYGQYEQRPERQPRDSDQSQRESRQQGCQDNQQSEQSEARGTINQQQPNNQDSGRCELDAWVKLLERRPFQAKAPIPLLEVHKQ